MEDDLNADNPSIDTVMMGLIKFGRLATAYAGVEFAHNIFLEVSTDWIDSLEKIKEVASEMVFPNEEWKTREEFIHSHISYMHKRV